MSDANAYTQRVNVVRIDNSGNLLNTSNLPLADYVIEYSSSTSEINFNSLVDTWITYCIIQMSSTQIFFDKINEGLSVKITDTTDNIVYYQQLERATITKLTNYEGVIYIKLDNFKLDAMNILNIELIMKAALLRIPTDLVLTTRLGGYSI